MNKKAIFIIVVIVAVLIIAIVAIRGRVGQTDEIVKVVIAGSEAPDSLLDQMSVRLEEYILEESEGSLETELVRGQVLGNANQVLEQHIAGSVDVMFSRPDHFSAHVDDFQVLSWGFTFRDREHMTKFLEGPIFEEMTDKLLDKIGVRVLAAAVDQPRIMYTRIPVQSIDDIRGIKMRVPQIKSYLKLWETLGTQPTQIAWAEAFLGLKTGVVDAAEADASGAYSQKFHLAVPYIIRTDHLLSTAEISVNDTTYQAMSSRQQEAIGRAAERAVAWMSQEALENTDSVLATMVAEGATVLEIDNAPFAERARAGVVEVEAEGLWPAGLWDNIRAIN